MLPENEKWFRVSLRLMGDLLPVDEIQSKLQIEPSSIGKKGSHIRDNPNHAKYETNGWVYRHASDSTVPFEIQIADLLAMLESKKSVLGDITSIPEVKAQLFLGFGSGNGQGRAYFSPEILRRIVDLELAVLLDLYLPDIDEEDTTEA